MDAMLLKVPDVVACLGVSRATVYELMASGALRSVRVGGSRRIRADDLEAFVAGLETAYAGCVCATATAATPERRDPHPTRPDELAVGPVDAAGAMDESRDTVVLQSHASQHRIVRASHALWDTGCR